MIKWLRSTVALLSPVGTKAKEIRREGETKRNCGSERKRIGEKSKAVNLKTQREK